jgi:transposase
MFKPCRQRQLLLLPPDISGLVPEGSMVRVVDSIIDSLGHSKLTALYPGGGTSAYDPAMMLKVVVCAYASGIYSSRKFSRATLENINFKSPLAVRILSQRSATPSLIL